MSSNALTPVVSERMRELIAEYGNAVAHAQPARENAAYAVLCREIAALEADRRRLDALEGACRAIDLRLNATPKRCYRWQIDAWGSERVYLRDAIDEQFAVGMQHDRPAGMPFTKAELEAIRHA